MPTRRAHLAEPLDFQSAAYYSDQAEHSGVILVLHPRCDLGTLRLAWLAVQGLMLKLLVSEENLFPSAENKVPSAVDASQQLVAEFHLGPHYGSRRPPVSAGPRTSRESKWRVSPRFPRPPLVSNWANRCIQLIYPVRNNL